MLRGKKKVAVIGPRAQWHMIGHLQTNKAKYAVNLFNYIHSVDRMDLLGNWTKGSLIGQKMNILIEVNVSGEKTKNGIPADTAITLIKDVSKLEKSFRPRTNDDGALFRQSPKIPVHILAGLRNLRDDIIRTGITGIQMEDLSMGMSDDFEVAIEEGATIVRIGRAIFGERKYKRISSLSCMEFIQALPKPLLAV